MAWLTPCGAQARRPDLALGGEADLIAESVGQLLELVEEAVERRDAEHDRRLVERALEET